MFDTGRIQNPAYKEEGRLDLSSYKPFYKLKNQLMKLSVDTLQHLTDCDDATAKEVLGLQKMYTFDVTHKEQQTYTSEFNITSFQQQRTQYTVNTNIDKGAFIKQWKGSGSFQHLHQEQQLVNTLTEIPSARSKLEKLSIEITN